jgi:hypothetical protein
VKVSEISIALSWRISSEVSFNESLNWTFEESLNETSDEILQMKLSDVSFEGRLKTLQVILWIKSSEFSSNIHEVQKEVQWITWWKFWRFLIDQSSEDFWRIIFWSYNFVTTQKMSNLEVHRKIAIFRQMFIRGVLMEILIRRVSKESTLLCNTL